MALITAVGTQAKENAEKSSVDLEKVYLRLKDGESHKVRLLSTTDFVEYTASGDFNLGIYTQAVSDMETSPLMVAHKHGGETFKNLYPKSRYVMVFGSLETGELVAWDCSKSQFKSMIATVEEYADVIDEIAFNIKRTGTKTETVYSLNPIIKMKPADKEAFDKLEGTKVEMTFYESIILPKPDKLLVGLLKEAGFDTDKYFPDIKLDDEGTEPDTSAEKVEAEGSDEDLLNMI